MIKHIYGDICTPLKHIFQQSLSKGIFPDALKIAPVTPLFNTGEQTKVSKHRPISDLPCFSNILERIMYSKLYEYLLKNKIPYNKQFGFQKSNSTEHAIMQHCDQLYDSFN